MAELREAKRTYSMSEIGVWLERISSGWEGSFSQSQLEFGRKIYTCGLVRSIDLNGDEAIISARFSDGSEPYAILEYSAAERAFSYRSSAEDGTLSGALAVAGLYEIEELVAGEVSDCATLDMFSRKPTEGGEPAEALDAKDGGASPLPVGNAVSAGGADEGRNDSSACAQDAMVLTLNFSSKRDGLYFSAYWSLNGVSVGRVFGEGAVDSSRLGYAERENLVRLITFARRHSFKYESDFFKLSEFSRIPHFVSEVLGQWAQYFKIRKTADVDLLALGERSVSVDSEAFETQDGNFDIKWTPKVGGEEISREDFSKLMTLGSGGVRILPSCGIVRISSLDESFVRNMERSRDVLSGAIPKYMLLTLFGGENGEAMRLTPGLKRWKKRILESAEDRSEEAELPPELGFLRPYQKLGVSWIDRLFSLGCGALLADEMGLGKTLQSLSVISERWDGKKSFLIVCPASVIPVWVSETKRFFPHMETAVLSSSLEVEKSRARIWISSYSQLRRNSLLLDDMFFEVAVLDEAQFIKNPDSKTTSVCSSIRARHRLALTGTPLENRLLDLWTIFRWLMPGLMGSRASFESFAEASAEAIAIVRRQIAPFVLRRMKNDVAKELPEKIYMDLACPMTQMQRSEYDKILARAREIMDISVQDAVSERRNRISVLSLITRLRQISCDAALLPWVESQDYFSSGKIAALLDKVEELASGGKKILVFSQFTSFLDRIKTFVSERVPGLPLFELTGSTRDRSQPVNSFQNARGAAMILVSLRAGGTGITLTNADYVFFMDPWWNPAVEEQAIDRVHRIGRSHEVFVYRMVAESTVEERVRLLKAAKSRLFSDMFSSLSDVSRHDKFFETVKELLK